MVLYIIKWNIRPDTQESYLKWAKGSIGTALSVPGLVEVRGYRPVTGSSQAIITYEFADLAAWEAWYGNDKIQQRLLELRAFTTDVCTELWGTSPVIPDPIRPKS